MLDEPIGEHLDDRVRLGHRSGERSEGVVGADDAGADLGGLFEYAPATRTATDENFDGIQRILEGDLGGVRTLDLQPGDLQIFRGRHSLHRVTRVGTGSKPRHAAIFAYTTEPGVIGRLARTQQLFGRTLPAHEVAERDRVRADALID